MTWVEPSLVAEIEFTEMTRSGRLRHPVFKGLRQDKAAREVVRETPRAAKVVAREASAPKGGPAKRPGGPAKRAARKQASSRP